MKREEHKVRISTRERLWKEQKGICSYCERKIKIELASLDHIIPVELNDELLGETNLTVTCISCNKRKGNMIIFTNLYDKKVYPILDIPYFFHYNDIVFNKKDKKGVKK